MSYQSPVHSRGDGLAAQLRAEWVKLRTVRGTAICMLLAIGVTVLLSALLSHVDGTDPYTGPYSTDSLGFVHQPVTGSAAITARLTRQADSQDWAKAGVIMSAGTRRGATYAALVLTPGHGLRLESAYKQSQAAGSARAPVWLRLTRSGTTVTGLESADGRHWHAVGSVRLALPATAQAGLMVTSPPGQHTVKIGQGSRTTSGPTRGQATFDHVRLQAAAAAVPWQYQTVGGSAAGFTQSAGTFTVTGSGDVAGFGIPSFSSDVNLGDDDVVADSLAGVQAGLIVVLALGVLVGTGEYRTGLARTTFTASPRRGRVLAARVLVLGGAVFAAGLVASAGAYLAAQPGQHENNFNPPAYPHTSLTDPVVARAVIGSALLFAVVALLGMAAGTLLRRPAPALIVVLAAFLVPTVVGSAALSVGAQKWLDRLTPAAGLAIQQTRVRFDTAISPLGGLAVVCAYAAVTLAAATILVRSRDA